jgi:hypothetical protein
MVTIKDAAAEFLATKGVAVTGVSRNPRGHGSNIVYQRLLPTADFGHKRMSFFCSLSGAVPKQVG